MVKGIITIILLILLTLSLLLSGRNLLIEKKNEEKRRANVDTQMRSLLGEKKKIEGDLEAASAIHDRLEVELNDVRRQLKASEDDAAILKESRIELSAKMEEIDKALEEASLSLNSLNKKKSELIDINQKLIDEKNVSRDMLKHVSLAKEGLENRINDIVNQGVSLKPVIVESESHARVIAVNTEHGFVVTNLGGPDLKKGRVISIYRDGALIARAKVNKIREHLSTAVVLPEWKGIEIKPGDSVTFAD